MNNLLDEVWKAQNMISGKETQDLSDYTLSSVLSKVAEYLRQETFVSVTERLPEFTHKDWKYTSEYVLGSILTDNGRRYTAPVRYEKTVIRGKSTERWTDYNGNLFRDRKVTHWRPFPELEENADQGG